jgi:UDP-glucose 4-epimerase
VRPGETVLVTGATGFLGSHLLRRLSAEGINAHGTFRRERPRAEYTAQWWQVDLTEADEVRAVFETVQPDVVFNMAGFATGAPDLRLVEPTYRANLTTTVNLLTAASAGGCRRLFLTASLTEPDQRDAQAIPGSPYAASKWAAGGYARMFHALYGLPVVSLRIFMAYGPAQRELKKLVPHATIALLQGEAPELTNGRVEMDWIYIDDVVEACLAAADAEGIEGQTLDIGSGRLFSVRDVVERLVSITGSPARGLFGALEDRPSPPVRMADTGSVSQMIGWEPAVDLDEGLQRTVRWYREQLEAGAL